MFVADGSVVIRRGVKGRAALIERTPPHPPLFIQFLVFELFSLPICRMRRDCVTCDRDRRSSLHSANFCRLNLGFGHVRPVASFSLLPPAREKILVSARRYNIGTYVKGRIRPGARDEGEEAPGSLNCQSLEVLTIQVGGYKVNVVADVDSISGRRTAQSGEFRLGPTRPKHLEAFLKFCTCAVCACVGRRSAASA